MKRLLVIGTLTALCCAESPRGIADSAPAGTPPPKTSAADAKAKLLADAKQIVSEPDNWKVAARNLTDLTERASDLEWDQFAEVLEFTKAASDLMRFCTRRSESFTGGTPSLPRDDRDETDASGSAARAENDDDASRTRARLRDEQESFHRGLSDYEAQQFTLLFRSALSAYQALYVRATRSR